MYMSYCRFEGTLQELRGCIAVVEECVNEENEYPVSRREVERFEVLVTDFYDWLCDMALLDEFGELNKDELRSIADMMEKGHEV